MTTKFSAAQQMKISTYKSLREFASRQTITQHKISGQTTGLWGVMEGWGKRLGLFLISLTLPPQIQHDIPDLVTFNLTNEQFDNLGHVSLISTRT